MTSLIRPLVSWWHINPATLSGACDIIVVKSNDGTYRSTPWHVRFGKFRILNAEDKIVRVYVNDKLSPFCTMKLGSQGEAHFVEETEDDVCSELLTSPLISVNQSPANIEPLSLDAQIADTSDSLSVEDTVLNLDPFIQSHETSSLDASACDPSDKGEDSASLPSTKSIPKPFDFRAVSDSMDARSDSGKSKDGGDGASVLSRDAADASEITAAQDDGKSLASEGVVDPYDKLDSVSLIREAMSPMHSATSPIVTCSKSDPEQESGVDLEPYTLTTLNAITSLDLSLCRDELERIGGSSAPTSEQHGVFNRSLITEMNFTIRGKRMLANDQLMARVNNEYILPWVDAAPIVTAVLAFGSATLDSSWGPPVGDVGGTASSREQTPPTSPSGRTRGRGGSYLWWIGRLYRRDGDEYHDDDKKADSDAPFDADLESGSNIAQPGSPVGSLATSSLLYSPMIGGAPNNKDQDGVRHRLSQIPNSDMLESLHLKPGRNLIRFVVTSGFQGTQEVTSSIYLWDESDKIVISDIDGTITKSDLMGHFAYLIGKDWTHSGITKLYQAIRKNDYRVLYLTSRAIGQAGSTRSYIRDLEKDGARLPDGPVLLSPDRLLESLSREIKGSPHEFKIAALNNVLALFPRGHKPFYAGFGNRDTDTTSYRAVGIPPSKIFIINPKGEIRTPQISQLNESYSSLKDGIDQFFPPFKQGIQESPVEEVDEAYNHVNFWKIELPPINPDDFLE
eukprot:Rmarinus@m.4882